MTEVVFEIEGVKKVITFLNRKAPYGTIYALEVLESVLITAAFEQHANIVFVDDGVYQIKKGQDTAALEMKNFLPTYGIIEMEKEDADEDEDMDMNWRIIVEKESMEARGLSADDFKIDVEVLSSAELAEVLETSDAVIGG
ncbi:MAG: DsrE family protein [Rhodospirillaceae bacterium]|nr:DsrE family protein [Rhodospirillaceae bacterium]